jgi:hypothetical protein
MGTGCRQKQVKTRQVIPESGHDGLRVLARIITRAHMKRMADKRINEDNHLHGGKQVIIVQKGPIKIKSDGELVDEEADEI